MKTVADYLKNAPKGTKLYSPIFGECTFEQLTHTDNICVRYNGKLAIFDKLGVYTPNNEVNTEGECLLFPSKEVREWSNYQLPHDFKPFDKVVVRDDSLWHINFFERYLPGEKSPYECLHGIWQHCLPFNEETAKLIGTRNERTSN
jgi:hypothetical protein